MTIRDALDAEEAHRALAARWTRRGPETSEARITATWRGRFKAFCWRIIRRNLWLLVNGHLR